MTLIDDKQAQAIAEQLTETDLLTPTDPETLRPETYYVETENLADLVKAVLGFWDMGGDARQEIIDSLEPGVTHR